MNTFRHFLTHQTALLIVITLLVSFSFPVLGEFFKPVITYFLMAVMFFSLLTINIRTIIKDAGHWRINAAVFCIVFFVSPTLSLILKPFLSGELFLGLIIATAMTSGLVVVFLSKLFGGDPAKALVITAPANLLSPIIVPLLVLLFVGEEVTIDPVSMMLTMVKIVIVPFILALLVRRTRIVGPLDRIGQPLSVVLLLCIILGIVSPVRDDILADPMAAINLGLFAALLVMVNFFLGFALGRTREERITYGITASYKNFTLATVVALTLFSPVVALPAILYALINNLLLIPLGVFRRVAS